MTEKYLIEGSVVMEKPTGISRLVIELVRAMDKLVEKGRFAFIIPNGFSAKVPPMNNIRIIEYGDGSSKKNWVMRVPKRFAKKHKMILINLGVVLPTSRKSSILIADTRLREGLFHETLRWRVKSTLKSFIATHTAKKIITISNFVKERLIHFYHIPSEKISVIYCAWQHFERIIPDEAVFDRFPMIKKGEYYYTIGSIAPHKNYKWIIEAAQYNPNSTFVVSGAMRREVWDSQGIDTVADNIIYTDYISDEEMKALLMHAKAFLFPTLYEGFGIPPMEAMSVGVDCIVSDIPVLHEIYGDAVHYIDPHCANVTLDLILEKPLRTSREEVLLKYSWEKSAKEFLAVLAQL